LGEGDLSREIYVKKQGDYLYQIGSTKILKTVAQTFGSKLDGRREDSETPSP